MKAAFIERPGPPESICYSEVETPVIRNARQVLVKVVAVTVNPIDTYIRSGAYPIALPRPFIIGRDLVGVVDSVGAGLRGLRPASTCGATTRATAEGKAPLPNSSMWTKTCFIRYPTG
jgi:NADPH:quinone reductase-like Zn-dependent oxidoreductase